MKLVKAVGFIVTMGNGFWFQNGVAGDRMVDRQQPLPMPMSTENKGQRPLPMLESTKHHKKMALKNTAVLDQNRTILPSPSSMILPEPQGTALSQQRLISQYAPIKKMPSESIHTVLPLPPKTTGELLTAEKTTALKRQIENLAFNDALFQNAYDIFLANRDLSNAFYIAKRAVTLNHTSFKWRNQLAQVAMWTGQQNVALEQWVYLIKNTMGDEQKKNLLMAVRIAESMQNYSQLIVLYGLALNMPFDQAAREKYIEKMAYAYNMVGDVDAAINVINQHAFLKNSKNGKLFLIQIYANNFDIHNELNAIDSYEKSFPLTPELAVVKAAIESKTSLHQALLTLSKVDNKDRIANVDYWKSVAIYAWDAQDYQTAVKAYENLRSMNASQSFEDQRIVLYYQSTDPQKAFTLAMQGWKKFHTAPYFDMVLYLGCQLKKWDVLKQFLASIPDSQRHTFLNNIPTYLTYINYVTLTQDAQKANQLYLHALHQWPSSLEIKRSYLWFLIDTGNAPLLSQQLSAWYSLALVQQDLWVVYAGGYEFLRNETVAAQFYEKLIQHNPTQFQWWYAYANALGGTELDKAPPAMQEKIKSLYLKSYTLLRANIAKNKGYENEEEQNIDAYLSARFSSADHADQLMRRLPVVNKTGYLNSVLMDMAFDKGYNEYTGEILKRYLHNTTVKIEPWVPLRQALIDHDTTVMNDELDHHLSQLPRRDVITASEETGRVLTAQSDMYHQLEKYPEDNELYSMYTRLSLKYANRWDVETRYYNAGLVSGPMANADYEYQMSPSTRLMLKSDNWMPSIDDKAQILRVPTVVEDTKAGFQYGDRHRLEMSVSQHHAFQNQFGGDVSYRYEFNSLLDMDVGGGVNQAATDSIPLQLAGLRDDAQSNVRVHVTPRDTVSLSGVANRYVGVDRSYLGSSLQGTAQYAHALRIWGMAWNWVFASSHWFNQPSNQPLTSEMSSLIPGNVNNAFYYVPQSSSTYSVTWDVNSNYLEEYTKSWRPILSTTYLYNTIFRSGYAVNLGVAGSVFGRDHLSFYGGYQNGTQAQAGLASYFVGAKYGYLF